MAAAGHLAPRRRRGGSRPARSSPAPPLASGTNAAARAACSGAPRPSKNIASGAPATPARLRRSKHAFGAASSPRDAPRAAARTRRVLVAVAFVALSIAMVIVLQQRHRADANAAAARTEELRPKRTPALLISLAEQGRQALHWPAIRPVRSFPCARPLPTGLMMLRARLSHRARRSASVRAAHPSCITMAPSATPRSAPMEHASSR